MRHGRLVSPTHAHTAPASRARSRSRASCTAALICANQCCLFQDQCCLGEIGPLRSHADASRREHASWARAIMQPSSWRPRTVCTHVGLACAARADVFTRATVTVREVLSLGQSAYTRMLVDESSPCIGSACVTAARYRPPMLTPPQHRVRALGLVRAAWQH